ncbi:TIGR02281 family clan AA aspartic protease [Thalassotalea euphylliae]|uniref:TIGR02281 family clan AA aspartic protease n=1 Tax=Thalassotalea euphylliae TaxID=1655234 RepID=A0A3E0UJ33_9GAMM|nr:TIGR02281 family clan AA aspartic protease [Thalassotalea euphylliae]
MVKDNQETSFGRGFIWIAWILAIGILIYAFQGVLDNQWNPNQRPDSNLSSQGKASVTLKQNRSGHYITSGTINDEPVVFLLDTGATQVSIPARVAERLGLQGYGSYPVQTANGVVRVYRTKIQSLSIGNLYLYDVDAHINPGMQSDEILLGMSALKKVEFRQTGNQLVLEQR